MAIKSKGIDHIHINYRDFSQVVQLFSKLFDLKEWEPLLLNHDNVDAREVVMNNISFFEPTSDKSPISKEIHKVGEGITALAFKVDNLDDAISHAESCGLKVLGRVGYPGVFNQVQFDTLHKYGFMLEMLEYHQGSEKVLEEIRANSLKYESSVPQDET